MIRRVRVTAAGDTYVSIDEPVNDEFKLLPGWGLTSRKINGKEEVHAIAPNGTITVLMPNLISKLPRH